MDSMSESGEQAEGTDGATNVVEQLPSERSEGGKWKLVSPQGNVAFESELDRIHLWSRSGIIDDLEVEDHIGFALEHLQRAWHKQSYLNDCIRRATSTLEDLYSCLLDEDEDEADEEGEEGDEEADVK